VVVVPLMKTATTAEGRAGEGRERCGRARKG